VLQVISFGAGLFGKRENLLMN